MPGETTTRDDTRRIPNTRKKIIKQVRCRLPAGQHCNPKEKSEPQ